MVTEKVLDLSQLAASCKRQRLTRDNVNRLTFRRFLESQRRPVIESITLMAACNPANRDLRDTGLRLRQTVEIEYMTTIIQRLPQSCFPWGRKESPGNGVAFNGRCFSMAKCFIGKVKLSVSC